MIALAEPRWPFFFNPAVGMASRGSLQLAKTSSNAIVAAKLASIQDLRGHEAGQIMGQGTLLHLRLATQNCAERRFNREPIE
jgi:hypothetical protein